LLGFQDRVRVQADKQTGVQIRNAIALLHANGELTLTDDGTYTVAADGTTTVAGITTVQSGGDGVGVEALVETLIDNIDPAGTSGIVTVQSDGEVQVTAP